MKMNKSCRVLVWYEFQQVRVFIHHVMQILDIILYFNETRFAQSIYILPGLNSITNSGLNIRNKQKHIVSNVRRFRFCRDVTMLLIEISLRSGFTIKKQVALFVNVLGTIQLNETKYARTSIYHVFLVQIGKSIPRAQCSIGGDEACRVTTLLHEVRGHQEHMKDTYNLTQLCGVQIT